MSCSTRGQPTDQVRLGPATATPGRWPARARSGCARTRPCAGGARPAPAEALAARAAPDRPARCAPAAPVPRRGRSVSSSLDSSSRTRSADTMAIRSAIAVIAAITRGAGVKNSWEVNRAARIIRNGSSLNDCSGVPGVSITSAARCGQATVRIHEPLARQLDGHRVDGEVAPDQVALEGVTEADLRLAAVGDVDVGAEGGHLDDPAHDLAVPGPAARPPGSRPCRTPCRSSRPPAITRPQDRLDVVGAGVGGEVEVVSELPAEGVPDAAADEVEGVSGGREQLAQPVGDRSDPQQLGHRVRLRTAQPICFRHGGRC